METEIFTAYAGYAGKSGWSLAGLQVAQKFVVLGVWGGVGNSVDTDI